MILIIESVQVQSIPNICKSIFCKSIVKDWKKKLERMVKTIVKNQQKKLPDTFIEIGSGHIVWEKVILIWIQVVVDLSQL